MSEKLLTVKDVAARWQVSEETVERLMRRGLLRGRKLGGCLRFAEADLGEYLEHARQPVPTPPEPRRARKRAIPFDVAAERKRVFGR